MSRIGVRDSAAQLTSFQSAGQECVQHTPLRMSEKLLILYMLDLAALNAGLLCSISLRFGRPVELQLLAQRPMWFLVLTLVWFAIAHTLNSYGLRIIGRWSTSATTVLKAGLLTAPIYLLIPYITPPLPASRSALVSFPILIVTMLLVGRAFYALTFPRQFFERRTLILGAGSAGQKIAQVLAETGDRGHRMIGFVDSDLSKNGTLISVPCHRASDGEEPLRINLPVLDWQSMRDLVGSYRISTLVLASDHEVDSVLIRVLLECLELGVEVVTMPVLYEQLTGRVPVEHLGNTGYVELPLCHPGNGALWGATKRLIDVFLGSVGLFFLAFFIPFIALAVYLDSPGPVFYVQERVGRGGRLFHIYKFRSMLPDAERDGPKWADENDGRTTRVGRFLRASHVDEFPQFLNILKGEMSAVGPRPERPGFVEQLAKDIPFYRVRHAVKPGMASWALVWGGYVSTKKDALVRLEYDLYYIKHQSLWLDIVILLKTFLHALMLKGR